MSPRSKRNLVLLAVLCIAAVAAVLAWLPWDPFEEPAGPLDGLVPRDVDSAWRFDGPALLASPFAAAAWNRPEVSGLRARWNLDDASLAQVRRLESAFSAIDDVIEAPSLERDLLPAEAIVATRGDEVLLVTRVSERAKSIQLVRRLPERRVERLGMSVEGPLLAVRDGTPRPVFFAVHRDVLLASMSDRFVRNALTVAEQGTGALAGREDAAAALALDRAAGARILGWVRPAALRRRLSAAAVGAAAAGGEDEGEEASEASSRPPWLGLLATEGAEPLRVEIDLSTPDALAVVAKCSWERGLPEALRPFTAGGTLDGRSLAEAAERLAPPGEAFVAGGLQVSAADVVRALLGSQPPETQAAFDEALAAAGESIEGVARGLAAHLEDGVSFVVARLAEADQSLGGDAPGAVRAIPATLVAFRLKGPGADRALLDDLRQRAQTIFGAQLDDTVAVLGDGGRIHALERHGLAGQWELLRPAFAFRGREFLFSTHEAFLWRAMGARDAATAGDLPGAGAFAARVRAGPLRAWIADQAWEAADRSTWRDWSAERARIEAGLSPSLGFRPQDRETYLDARIQEMKRQRRQVEIPEAVAAWRERWTWLDAFGDATLAAETDAAGGSVTLRVRLALPKRE